jgi:hypothetical protein
MHPVKMSLDIFRKDPHGEVMWVAAAETPASAKAKIDELCLTQPGDYFVFNQETGRELQLPCPPEDASGDQPAKSD